MAAEKKTDFKSMSMEDLENRYKEFNEELQSAKLKFRIGQFKKTSEFPRLRKEIARIKTAMRQMQASEKA